MKFISKLFLHKRRLKQIGNSDRLAEGSPPSLLPPPPHFVVSHFNSNDDFARRINRQHTQTDQEASLTQSPRYIQGIKIWVATKDILKREALYKIATARDIAQRDFFQIHVSVFGVYFSNNISIPQVRFNIRETKHDTQVLKSLNY